MIEAFRTTDVRRFMELANTERWVAEPWEFAFLLSAFPEGCFISSDETGRAAGFVTSIRHDRSGWIGNLIVSRERRGKGIGQELFAGALSALRLAGVETVWLTASKQGKSLYEKHGFASIDTIVRWTGEGRGMAVATPYPGGSLEHEIDRLGWDDRRDALLEAIRGRGEVLSDIGAMAIIQPCGHAVQIGPFASLDPPKAASLLEAALAAIPSGVKVHIDAPAGNLAVFKLLQKRGFRSQGSNELMYAGTKPAYQPEYVYGLASMGSMG